ncbi:Alpha/Beta hydrolase protein [Apiosordaria backusii]|uniref:Alpha/Beta hydrolase protein n=1 Tax=Apiosordaria backusii TaxID=314023 RepID=A0AA40ECI5_9PEZI|nr:Alpha/Beta hydrolase protein [Apiosordaria backusii]
MKSLNFFLWAASAATAITTPMKTDNNTIDTGPFPSDLNGSNFTYTHPFKLFHFHSQGLPLEMVFIDLPPAAASTTTATTQPQHFRSTRKGTSKKATPRSKTALLLHGKNFCSITWSVTATALQKAGYRVIIPDQIGFCKSSKPGPHYHFSLHQLALNTFSLLSALNLTDPHDNEVTVVGHSLGGMLATRFSLLYPQIVSNLVLVNPIGLEPYLSLGVPYPDLSSTLEAEQSSNYKSIRGYEQSTYYLGAWAPEYDVWAVMLAQIYAGSEAQRFAEGQARVVDMVLTQPVFYEFSRVRANTLLMVGTKDTTAIGKQWSPPGVQAMLGKYEVLGKETANSIPNCTLVEFGDLGHAPQIQAPDRFHSALLQWLRE